MNDLIDRLQQTAHATRDDHAAHAIHSAVVELRRVNAEADRVRETLNGRDQQPRTKGAAHMSDDNERSVASTGSVGPVAWAVMNPNDEVAVIAFKRRDADERASASDRVVPLYRHSQPALTDAEREAIVWAVSAARNVEHPAEHTLRGLLERLRGQYRMIDDMATQRECAKACMRRMDELNIEKEKANLRTMNEVSAEKKSNG